MEKEIKREQMANPPGQPESEQQDKMVEEINESKDVTRETMLEELEETKKSLKQG